MNHISDIREQKKASIWDTWGNQEAFVNFVPFRGCKINSLCCFK